jgi:hypothetical protein
MFEEMYLNSSKGVTLLTRIVMLRTQVCFGKRMPERTYLAKKKED